MYLHEIMEDSDKNEHSMVGIIKGKCRKTDRLQRFGYMEMTANRDNILCKKATKSVRGSFIILTVTVTETVLRL